MNFNKVNAVLKQRKLLNKTEIYRIVQYKIIKQCPEY